MPKQHKFEHLRAQHLQALLQVAENGDSNAFYRARSAFAELHGSPHARLDGPVGARIVQLGRRHWLARPRGLRQFDEQVRDLLMDLADRQRPVAAHLPPPPDDPDTDALHAS